MKRARPARTSAVALAAALAALAAAPVGAAPLDEGGRARVAAFVLDEDGVPLPGTRGATLLYTLEQALRGDPRLEVVDRDLALARRADLIPNEALAEALGLLSAGEALLRQDQPGDALPRLETAERTLAENLAFASERDYARAQFLIGVAHAMLRDDAAADWAFTRLLVWRAEFVADTTIAPAQVLPRFEAAREQLAGLGAGSIDITSAPAGAAAYVDGRFVGFTPTFAAGLTAGEHHVTFRAIGFVPAVETVRVSSRVERRARVTLQPSPGRAQLEALVDEVAPALGRARGGAALGELGALLGVDHLFVVQMPRAGRGDGRYRGWVYEATTRRELAAAELAPADDLGDDRALAALADALYRQITPEPPSPRARRSERGRVTLHRQWWFWTGVAAVAAVVATPLLLDRDSGGPRCPDGSVCGHVVWRY